MESNARIKELERAFKDKKCFIKEHSNVISITFENEKDADWFENVFQKFQLESAACCLMPIRPKNALPKFIFNIKDINKFIELIKENY
ncbi:MAG: hypothetical protein ACPK7O_08750 [Methanobacterium sp.]